MLLNLFGQIIEHLINLVYNYWFNIWKFLISDSTTQIYNKLVNSSLCIGEHQHLPLFANHVFQIFETSL